MNAHQDSRSNKAASVTCETATRVGADWRPLHALLLVAFLVGTSWVPVLRVWPFLWLVPLAGYGIMVALLRPLRATFSFWRFGRLTPLIIAATILISVGSCSVLTAFHLLTRPDLTAFTSFVPVSSLGGLLAGGILFSLINALCEEFIFRGILFDAIEAEWSTWIAVVATAFLFGYGHMRGYPPGPLGAVLAGIYGLCLGWLRVFSRGLGLPVIAHITADATIFTLIAHSGAFNNA